MDPITRREGKLLRQLAATAYDRELSRALDRLEASFLAWRAGGLSPHDVSAAVHEFHDGVARDLWVLYNRIDPSSTVPRAVAAGLLAESEIPAEVLAKLESALLFYRNEFRDSNSSPPAV